MSHSSDPSLTSPEKRPLLPAAAKPAARFEFLSTMARHWSKAIGCGLEESPLWALPSRPLAVIAPAPNKGAVSLIMHCSDTFAVGSVSLEALKPSMKPVVLASTGQVDPACLLVVSGAAPGVSARAAALLNGTGVSRG